MNFELIEKTKKSIFSGLINKGLSLLLPFVVRSLVISRASLSFLGLKSLFNSVFQILNIAEFGIGEAILCGMFKPIARNDKETINSLLSFYKKAYNFIGLLILLLGFLFFPFLTSIVDKNPEAAKYNINIIYILLLINTAFSYWFGSYKKSILQAYHRLDVINNLNSILGIFMNVSEILVLLFVPNIYLFMTISIVFTIINNLMVSKLSKIVYPYFSYTNKRIKTNEIHAIKNRIVGLSFRKICEITRLSFDNVLINTYFGIDSIAIYNNYILVISTVSSFLSIINSSLISGIGNRISTVSIEKNYSDLRTLNMIYLMLSGWCVCFLLRFYQPFVSLWIGDQYLLPYSSVILFVTLFYIQKLGAIQSVYTSAVGLFWENKYRYLFESVLHVILSAILIKHSINGVLLSSIISLFICGTIPSPIILFKSFFKMSPKQYFTDLVRYSYCVFLSVCTVCFISLYFNTSSIVAYFLINISLCSFVYLIVLYLFLNNDFVFKEAYCWFKKHL